MTSPNLQATEIELRRPGAADAAGIWRMVRDSGVLDLNSCYAYLLLTTHFADTCVVACGAERLLGFVTAYFPPARPQVLFVWQIAVAAEARGRGLATRMLRHLLDRDHSQRARYLEATVTPSNDPSRRMFASLAATLGTDFSESPGFTAGEFPTSEHDEEHLIRIGPLGRNYGDV